MAVSNFSGRQVASSAVRSVSRRPAAAAASAAAAAPPPLLLLCVGKVVVSN